MHCSFPLCHYNQLSSKTPFFFFLQMIYSFIPQFSRVTDQGQRIFTGTLWRLGFSLEISCIRQMTLNMLTGEAALLVWRAVENTVHPDA